MNFFDINKMNNQYPSTIPQQIPYDINYKINELENIIKKLELRISYLENQTNNNYIEPDNKMYMI